MPTDPNLPAAYIPISISDSSILLEKLAPVESGTAVARVSPGPGSPEEVPFADLKVALAFASSDVGLENVDNTSDADKPISTATQSALDDKSDVGHTHSASEIDDFDAAVAASAAVAANTAKRSYPSGDETKLAGIEAGAQVNPTAAAIKTSYESNENTNAYTDAEKSKLAGLESSKYLGLFVDVAALETAHPAPAAGSYADVDAGAEAEVSRYIWDASDASWTQQLGAANAETAASVKTKYEENPDTNAFTDSEKSKLAGIAASATANATNAELRDRATHTGSQAASTISDFESAVAAASSVAANTAHAASASNPHGVTKAQVGLGSANNTSDADKPVSTAQQAALDLKVASNVAGIPGAMQIVNRVAIYESDYDDLVTAEHASVSDATIEFVILPDPEA